MRDSRPRDVAESREIGMIANLPPVHHVLELDGEGHESGDSRNSRPASRVRDQVGLPRFAALVATWPHWQRRLDLDGPIL